VREIFRSTRGNFLSKKSFAGESGVSFQMQPVTVAIADLDDDRRTGCERILQNEAGITLLKNIPSKTDADNNYAYVDRRLKPRDNITASEDEVARVKRLNPHVMLVNIDSFADEDCALLLSLRRKCPESLIVLMTDDSVHDNQIIDALELGARGYLKNESLERQVANAVRVVGRGEAWVSRKLLGNIMDQMLT
jgi:DNA-binding NarL/FixJ family response regulator